MGKGAALAGFAGGSACAHLWCKPLMAECGAGAFACEPNGTNVTLVCRGIRVCN